MTTDDSSVFIETTFNSSIESVWEAWTNPIELMKWFGSDPKGTVLKAETDLRPGGYFEVTFRDADLTEHTCSGIYDEVQTLYKLAFSWQWKSEPGVASFIIVLLTPEGTSTRMQFEHKNLGTGSKHNYAVGWQITFSKLERVLEIQP
ncbi:MAG: SRPBCC domain-containing protein [Bacteroidota bacterium]